LITIFCTQNQSFCFKVFEGWWGHGWQINASGGKKSLGEPSENVELTLSDLSMLKTAKAKAIRFTILEAICSA